MEETPKFGGKQEGKSNRDIFTREMWAEQPLEKDMTMDDFFKKYQETGFVTVIHDSGSDLWVKEGNLPVPEGVKYKNRSVFEWKGDSWETIEREDK